MTTVGEIEYEASIDTSQFKKGAREIDQLGHKMEASGQETSDRLSTGFSKVAKVGLAAIATAAVAVGAVIAKTFDNAVKRVDTLNNSSRVFSNLGFKAEDVNKAMKALDQSIRGLPTPLDEAVRNMQLLAGSTNDIGKSQKIFSAINNAIIGFGGTTEDVSASVIQLSEAFSDGRVDSSTWLSLVQNGLGPALNALARDMGLTMGELKKGLSEGTISAEDFQNAMIKMNEKGGGGIKSFEQIAKDATSGIGTSWTNMQTAITRGIAKVIEAIGYANIANLITNIGKAFEGGLNFAIKGIEAIKAFFGFIRDNQEVIKQLVTVITILLTPAIMAFGIQSTIAFGKYLAGLALAVVQTTIASVRMAASWLLALGPIGLVVAAVAAAAFLIIRNWDKIKSYLSSFWNWLKSTASSAFNWVKGTIVGLINGIKSTASAVWNAVKGVSDRIGQFFNGAGSWLVDTGKAIIQGLINGIKGMAGAVGGAIKDVASGAINSAKSALGIQSPSKVFAQIGQYMTLGMAKGISNKSTSVSDAMSGVINGIDIPSLSSVSVSDLSQAGGGIENNIGNIYISSEVDGDNWIRRLTRDQEVIGKGLTPQTSYS